MLEQVIHGKQHEKQHHNNPNSVASLNKPIDIPPDFIFVTLHLLSKGWGTLQDPTTKYYLQELHFPIHDYSRHTLLGLSIFTFRIQNTNRVVNYLKIFVFHFGYHGIDRKRWGMSLITDLIQTIGCPTPMTIIWDFLHLSLHLLVNSHLPADFFFSWCQFWKMGTATQKM